MTHLKATLFASSFAAIVLSHTAHAQTAAPAASSAPAETALEMSYNLGIVTDYRYRGLSQTVLKPAVQGGFDGTYGGLYFGAWASNIKWVKDYGGKGNAEIDLYGGYKFAVTKDVNLDLGVLTYQYPSNGLNPSANTNEVYIGASTGPFSAKYSHSTTNLFGFSNSKGSGYLEANLDMEMSKGLNLVAHIGRQIVKNNSTANYTDYKLGVTYEALGGKFAASVVGANEDFYSVAANKNVSKAGLVLGYSKTF